MAKDPPETEQKTKSETPFRKFERLVGKIVRVPMDRTKANKQSS